MTTLIAIEDPSQVAYLSRLADEHVSDDERTDVVHAAEPSADEVSWAECRTECASLGDEWDFHVVRGSGTPGERLVAFAGERDVDRITLITPGRTATGKVETGSTAMEILLADEIRGELRIADDFLHFEDLAYDPDAE